MYRGGGLRPRRVVVSLPPRAALREGGEDWGGGGGGNGRPALYTTPMGGLYRRGWGSRSWGDRRVAASIEGRIIGLLDSSSTIGERTRLSIAASSQAAYCRELYPLSLLRGLED